MKIGIAGFSYSKPRDLLEYVIVHEMVYLLEPTNNDLPLAAVDWGV